MADRLAARAGRPEFHGSPAWGLANGAEALPELSEFVMAVIVGMLQSQYIKWFVWSRLIEL
jgi:hypothetical protein